MVNRFKAGLAFMYFMTNTGIATADVVELGNPKKNLEFKRYLENTPNSKSLNEAYLERELSKTEEILTSKYELAVKGLLLEDLKPSTFVFKEIVSWKKKSFINENSAQIILQSHMRLAHLDPTNSTFWLKHALFFNPSYEPENGLFNPDLTTALNNQKKEQSPYLYSINKTKLSDDNTLLFINGVNVRNNAKIHPSGEFHFTFLKDGFEKLNVAVSGEDIIKLTPAKLKPLNLGTCDAPNFKKRYGIQIEKIYFSADCIKSIKDSQEKVRLAESQTKPPSLATAEPPQQGNPPSRTKQTSIFKKKTTWYVIGAAVATGILVSVISNQTHEPRVIPVER